MSGRLFTPDGPAVTPTERRTRAAESRRAQVALFDLAPRSCTPPDAAAFIEAADRIAGPWLSGSDRDISSTREVAR